MQAPPKPLGFTVCVCPHPGHRGNRHFPTSSPRRPQPAWRKKLAEETPEELQLRQLLQHFLGWGPTGDLFGLAALKLQEE